MRILYFAMVAALLAGGIVNRAQTPSTRSSASGQNQKPPEPAIQSYQPKPEVMRRYFPNLASAKIEAQPATEGTTVDEIKFDGGPPEKLANLLRNAFKSDQFPGGPNIMIAPGMRKTEIPPFELHNVSLADVFKALNSLFEANKGGQWVLSGSNEPIWILNPPPGWVSPNYIDPLTGQPLDPMTGLPVSRAGPRETAKAPAREKQVVAIEPIGKYLSDYKLEDITTAIETAWGMTGDTGAQLKYHKDTNLLIAVGTVDQLRVVTQVLSSLNMALNEKHDRALQARKESAQDEGGSRQQTKAR